MSQEKADGSFDFDAWKSQGEEALAQLSEREKELEGQLSQIRQQQEGLRASLGKSEVKTRVRIRPTLIRLLEEKAGEPVKKEDLQVLAEEALPKASAESIASAIDRLGESGAIQDRLVVNGDALRLAL